MPLEALLERTPEISEEDFNTDNLGELRSDEVAWNRFVITDGANTLVTLPDVRVWLAAHQDRISEACTGQVFGGPVGNLPHTIGSIRDAFLSRGFAIHRSSRGDFLSTTNDELLRQQNYLRGDYLAVLAVDIVPGTDAFRFELCVMSQKRCRSPAIVQLQKNNELINDEYIPRVGSPSSSPLPPHHPPTNP